jgi:hypothetical protein
MIKALIVASVYLAATCSCALAQTGSSKSSSDLNAEVFTFFPDQNAGQIIPFNTRQMLLDIIASPLAGNTVTLGGSGTNGSLVLNGSTSGSSTLAAGATGALSLAAQTGTSTSINDGSNGTIAQFSGAGGAIANDWLITPGLTGNPITQTAQGTDTNIRMRFQNKGAEYIQFFGTNSSWLGVSLGGVNLGNGALTVSGNTSGNFVISSSLTGVPTMSTPWPVAAGGTGDTGTAWTTYTPTATCGTATFTYNSARYKSIGKTYHINLDFTISAVGTCVSGTPLQVSLPVTSQGSMSLSGSEVITTQAATTCRTIISSNNMQCFEANAWATGNRILVSGVFESQ